MDLLTGPLADALRRNRQTFNTKFAVANRTDRPIDGTEFQYHLAGTLDPIVRAVAGEFAEKTDSVVQALFDLSLELFSHNLLGPKSKYQSISAAWREFLPLIPRLVARQPARVAASVTNGLYNLSRTPGTRSRDWTQGLISIGSSCLSVKDLLDCGVVLAWRCGMPQYRQAALEKAASLSATLAAHALGLPPSGNTRDVIQRLTENPWIKPQDALAGVKRELNLVSQAGDFRGFAGQFLSPPRVAVAGGALVASDSTGSWRLHADVHNAILLRCEAVPPPLPSAGPPPLPTPGVARITPDGTISWQGQERRFPKLAHATSIASTADTVAITIPTSYHVFLVGLS